MAGIFFVSFFTRLLYNKQLSKYFSGQQIVISTNKAKLNWSNNILTIQWFDPIEVVDTQYSKYDHKNFRLKNDLIKNCNWC